MKNKTPTPYTAPPTILVIFGITGDLSRRKLLPALWHLFYTNQLSAPFRVIGFARRDFSTDEIRAFVRETLDDLLAAADKNTAQRFLDNFFYQQGQFDAAAPYDALAARIKDAEQALGAPATTIFYLSIAPVHYETVFQALHDSGVVDVATDTRTQSRILVEKPFGRDTETAQALDEKLGHLFREEQIYRIDHYLAKETVQNILNFRFSNFIFEPIWNKDGIEKVHIELLETLGMEGRGAFYSDTGALRDVGQNHLLQLLAMVAMENPGQYEAAHVRVKRAEVLARLRAVSETDLARSVVRGQYEGFAKEPGVTHDPQTETYFKLRVFLDDPVWEGVPFILESGKRMRKDLTRVTIYFKHASRTLCPLDDDHPCQNTLTFEIKPTEGITVSFWAKKPGFSNEIEQRALHFDYRARSTDERLPDAYERVLYDAIRGDQTLFASTEEVHAAWRYITPILKEWQKVPLEPYAPGGDGPESRATL
ncbi:MAG: glucose-6-phosphate dehydrogenase [Parcubacteria group bacterium 21-54-25]|nr:MAG: glucose-6-phosphate dehydrogenase [Parcubacteria group bacterium 21-54-25]HQU07567.1 glucose-6-phosphate dehydrogenase [Candidatus Paceibacterota bacterium]